MAPWTLFLCALAAVAVGDDLLLPREAFAGEEACSAEEDCGLELRQLRVQRISGSLRADAADDSGQQVATCSTLKNHGTFSSVDVSVGTPPQTFELVADTGSDNMIVQSCFCQERGYCPLDFGKCFRGSGQSSSFAMEEGPDGPVMNMMAFGSGKILVALASDEVSVGAVTTRMNNSLLLMVKQALKIQGSFEGILGLGRPHRHAMRRPGHRAIEGFMQAAGIERFSMCFNDGKPGVLGLNGPARGLPLQSVGTMHWGLDFRGISIGDSTQAVAFCTAAEKKPGMETACGIIPDSGTTLIMGPAKQIASLYTDLCTRWPRCAKMHDALTAEYEHLQRRNELALKVAVLKAAKVRFYQRVRALLQAGDSEAAATAEAFRDKDTEFASAEESDQTAADDSRTELPRQVTPAATLLLLLKNCHYWLVNGTDLSEMPSLFFHVAGTAGGLDTLEMKPNTWVLEMSSRIVEKHTKKLLGYLPVEIVSVSKEHVCSPAFGHMEYPTTLNGPVWIMGTPLFYQYQVHYDRGPDPPTMNFVREPCGACVDGKYTQSVALLQGQSGRALRRVDGEPVIKDINTTLPL
eukprot:TRINITY_DN26558_c0_g1_i1.p1 TRINITY_DN26558_c0_g1~~TRINITY_DN26558_c0_g1_i1.p1  ORF type:complete len:578 (+),score=104.78 TRINITY_DN26558_c0_g1_i1:73-1806(+)